MSCDNIQSNGEVAKKMLTAFAELRDPVFRNWLTENCIFPNSMVDRITPATTDEHRALVKEKFGIDDGWPVMTESFKQWVIEDHFVQGRPKWELVGAQMTTDVLPYEKMKLRLLNASHQALCYIGMLLGYQLVHETMEDPDIRKLVEKMMDEEVTPILSAVPGVDLDGIQEDFDRALCESGNSRSAFTHRNLWFVGNSQVRPALDRGATATRRADQAAELYRRVWFRYLSGWMNRARKCRCSIPWPELRERAKAAGKDADNSLAMREVFSEELANAPAFVKQVTDTLHSFYEEGARATLVKSIS